MINESEMKSTDQSISLVSCENCEHCLKMIGIGQGYKCSHSDNQVNGKMFAIPNRNHSCELFIERTRL